MQEDLLKKQPIRTSKFDPTTNNTFNSVVNDVVALQYLQKKIPERGSTFGMQAVEIDDSVVGAAKRLGKTFVRTGIKIGRDFLGDVKYAMDKVANTDLSGLIQDLGPVADIVRTGDPLEVIREKGLGKTVESIRELEYLGDTWMDNVDKQALVKSVEDMNRQTRTFIDSIGVGETGQETMFDDIIAGTSSLAGALGVSFLTKNPAAVAALFGGSASFRMKSELLDLGIDVQKAEEAGFFAGLAEGGLEFIGLHLFLENLKANGIISKTIRNSAVEAVQEFSQEAAGGGIGKIYGKQDTIAEILQRSGYSGLIGSFVGGGVSMGASVVQLKQQGLSEEESFNLIKSLHSKISPNRNIAREMNNTLKRQTSNLSYPGGDIDSGVSAFKEALTKSQEQNMFDIRKRVETDLTSKGRTIEEAKLHATIAQDVAARVMNEFQITPEEFVEEWLPGLDLEGGIDQGQEEDISEEVLEIDFEKYPKKTDVVKILNEAQEAKTPLEKQKILGRASNTIEILAKGDPEWDDLRSFISKTMSKLVEQEYYNREIQQLAGDNHTDLKKQDAFEQSIREELGLSEEEEIPETYYQFAGKGALTANKGALAKAKTLSDFKTDAKEILMETGWFKGSDGEWRFEVSDIESRLGRIEEGVNSLEEALQHDKLYQAYPQMKEVKVFYEDFSKYKDQGINPSRDFGFMDNNGNIRINKEVESSNLLKDILLHESQHIIQETEGFAKGGTRSEIYNKLAGEREAVNVTTRKDYTDQQRLDIFPDVRESDILKQEEAGRKAKGAFIPDMNLIKLFETADKTTLMHESAHWYLYSIQKFNDAFFKKNGKNSDIYETITEWLGKPKENGFSKVQQEKFARGFEAFIYEGKVENSRLREAFKQLADWFKDVYARISEIKYRNNQGQLVSVRLSNQARQLYNDILSSPYIDDKAVTPSDLAEVEALYQEDYQEAKKEVIRILQDKDISGKDTVLKELEDATKELDIKVAINRATNLIRSSIDSIDNLSRSTATNDIYEDAVQVYSSKIKPKDLLKERGIEPGRLTNWWQESIQPLSTVLKGISPKITRKLRTAEMNTNLRMQEFVKETEAFARGAFEMSKASQADYAKMDLALKNGDLNVLMPILEKHGLVEEYNKTREALEVMRVHLVDAGVPVGQIENYFPRQVKKPKEYLAYLRGTNDWRTLEKTIKDKGALEASESEQAQIINDYLAAKTLVDPRIAKGPKEETGSDSTKGRTIATIDANMNLFYEDAIVGMITSVSNINNAITLNEFFNTSKEVKEDTIGEIVQEATNAGMFKPEDAKVLTKALQAYFVGNSTSKWVRLIKNITYLTGLTKITSTMTQFKDLYVSSYRNGLFNTLGSVLTKKEIKAIELGVDRATAEIQDVITALSKTDTTMDKALKKSQVALETSLKLTGFSGIDMMGKNTFVKANLTKMRTEATKNPDRLISRLSTMFEQDQVDQIIKDLNDRVNSSLVKELLFYNLSDSMPIARTEMPMQYLRSDKGRLFYTFKSYTLRQFDIIYNDALKKMAAGKNTAERVEGAVNLFKVMSFMIMFGVPVDYLKDLILRKEPDEPEDYVIENILQGFGITRWTLKMAQREGIEKAVMQTLAPATPYLFEIFRDVQRSISKDDYTLNDFRSVNAVPLVGNLYYWWFGGGSDK